ncbi:MAG TPA: phage portal protein [Blastocatellia bacterium]|nr:phage portal protein [Blastocatellia bacterium]
MIEIPDRIIEYSYDWHPEADSQKTPSLWALLYQSVKAALKFRFTGYGGSTGQSWGSGWNWSFGNYGNSRINYALEAGKLTQSSLVMAAVNWLGRVLPEAPLQVVEADADGKEKPIIGHAAIKLLNRPNPFYSGAQLWKTFALSWITSGNPYFLKVRNGFGQVVELWYVPPSMIGPRWPEDGSEFVSYYEYMADGRIERIEVEDVIHFRDGGDPANQGRTGLSPIASILREICGDNEVATYQFLLLKHGGVPPVALALKDGVNSMNFDPEKVKQDYIRATTGDERGKVFVSNRAIELTKLGFNPTEMDLKVLRHLPESRFASVIGIAKETLGYGAADENSTYNNVQSADERSIQSFVRPLWGYIEDELTHQLGPDFELTDNQRFAFDLSEIAALQEDENALHERAQKNLASGGITVNEYRAMINLQPRDDGDVYLRSSSVQAVTPEMVKASIQSALVTHRRTIQGDPTNTDPSGNNGNNPPQPLNGRDNNPIN